jgi:hypothetical protein
MRGATRKILMGFLVVFMVFLIALTSVTTVTAQDGWGTLKTGDEMQWQSEKFGTVKMKVLNVEGETISLELNEGGSIDTLIIAASEGVSSGKMQDIAPNLIAVENSGDYDFTTTTYDFEGTTYQAFYSKSEQASGAFAEWWYDTNTGILFELRRTEADDSVIVKEKLTSTTADLATSSGSYGTDTGSCLGTLLIALVSVTTVISYSLLLWKKKKL